MYVETDISKVINYETRLITVSYSFKEIYNNSIMLLGGNVHFFFLFFFFFMTMIIFMFYNIYFLHACFILYNLSIFVLHNIVFNVLSDNKNCCCYYKLNGLENRAK